MKGFKTTNPPQTLWGIKFEVFGAIHSRLPLMTKYQQIEAILQANLGQSTSSELFLQYLLSIRDSLTMNKKREENQTKASNVTMSRIRISLGIDYKYMSLHELTYTAGHQQSFLSHGGSPSDTMSYTTYLTSSITFLWENCNSHEHKENYWNNSWHVYYDPYLPSAVQNKLRLRELRVNITTQNTGTCDCWSEYGTRGSELAS